MTKRICVGDLVSHNGQAAEAFKKGAWVVSFQSHGSFWWRTVEPGETPEGVALCDHEQWHVVWIQLMGELNVSAVSTDTVTWNASA